MRDPSVIARRAWHAKRRDVLPLKIGPTRRGTARRWLPDARIDRHGLVELALGLNDPLDTIRPGAHRRLVGHVRSKCSCRSSCFLISSEARRQRESNET